MRIITKRRGFFNATHKGCEIQIDRETDPSMRKWGRNFYIIVIAPNGGLLYDGWSPEGVNTMAEAKREALYGSCLKERPAAHNTAGTSPATPAAHPETSGQSRRVCRAARPGTNQRPTP